jgi:hypothetical protein
VQRCRWPLPVIVAAGIGLLPIYAVHARIVAPFGLRPTPEQSFSVDERAQAFLDRKTGRPGPVHLVRGAQQHEDLIFDLPRNVEQPALVFLPANDPFGLVNLLFGEFWQPHRFNLRYD